ncbi:hypothetical protein PR048_017996 [Dryococelus australis]|uniref:Uncharacterized protein n=1 Tax=Dryococelus australis TaxID=614101 RepID=A0ABQ9HB63_9NEOP|nr:hypothetical protein PR048_017996 [Dryococelus australis]
MADILDDQMATKVKATDEIATNMENDENDHHGQKQDGSHRRESSPPQSTATCASTVSEAMHATAWELMTEAAKEEAALAKEVGTSMEQGIIVDGLVQNMNMHSLKYNKLFSDGDSSIHRKLCRNHVLRYCMNKVRDIFGNPRLGNLQLRTTVQTQTRHRTADVSAIKYRKGAKIFNSNYKSLEELKNDVLNNPYVLGNHDKRVDSKYFCTNMEKQIWSHSFLKAAGILQELLIPIRHVTSHQFDSRLIQFAEQNHLTVDTCGLLADEDFPFLGASLDELIGDYYRSEMSCVYQSVNTYRSRH